MSNRTRYIVGIVLVVSMVLSVLMMMINPNGATPDSAPPPVEQLQN